MAEEKPSLHVDTDWKRQAQEEKKRLAEEEAKKAAAVPTAPVASGPSAAASPHRLALAVLRGRRCRRQVFPYSFSP